MPCSVGTESILKQNIGLLKRDVAILAVFPSLKFNEGTININVTQVNSSSEIWISQSHTKYLVELQAVHAMSVNFEVNINCISVRQLL